MEGEGQPGAQSSMPECPGAEGSDDSRTLASEAWVHSPHTFTWLCLRQRESPPRRKDHTAQSRAAKDHLFEALNPTVSIMSDNVIILRQRLSL